LVYNDHGSGEELRLRLLDYVNPITGEKYPIEAYITEKNIKGEGDEGHVKAAAEFINLLSKVGNGGNILMAACQIGYYENMGNTIMEQPSIKNVNLYLNGDKSTLSYVEGHMGPFEGKFNGAFLTKNDNFESGWRLFTKDINVPIPWDVTTNKNVGNVGVNSNGTVNVNPDFQPRDKFPSENEDGNR